MILKTAYNMKPPPSARIITRPPGLVGCWLMNEGGGQTVLDSSGNSYTLTAYNGPVWSAGKFGSSLLFVRGSSQYLEQDVAVITGYPFTMCCWFNTVETANEQTPVWIGDKDADNEYFEMQLATGTTKHLRITARTSSTIEDTYTTNIISENKWHFGVYVGASPTNRKVILDADFANQGTGTTSITPSGLNRTSIARLGRLSPLYYMDGQISHVMIFNYALTASEIAQLYYDPWWWWRRRARPELASAATPAGIPIFRRRREAC